jgi:ABC-2 type transport system ATP-binding protein
MKVSVRSRTRPGGAAPFIAVRSWGLVLAIEFIVTHSVGRGRPPQRPRLCRDISRLARLRGRLHIEPMHDPAIRASGLTKRFGDILAVDGIDLIVPAGHIVGLLGGNGAGKTTTIGMILGLLLPTAGAITVLGEDMLRHRHRVLPRMNFSSPYVDLPKRLTVRENLTVYAELYGLVDVRRRIAQLAEELSIVDFLGRPNGELSSGQRTRVALAKSLLNAPELLLFDEPTASLDPDTADWVRRYLVEYARTAGATLLVASHNMVEVERLCTEVIMMKRGRIVDQGATDALIARYGRHTLEEVFLDIARGRSAEDMPTAAQ